MPRVLQAVALVLRRHPAAAALPHVRQAITGFLGPSPSLSLFDACTLGPTELLDWIWDSSGQNPSHGWSLCNFLQTDKHYFQWQFSTCLKYAAERGDLELVKWLFAHFSDCEVPQDVVRATANNGHLEVLQFLLSHDSGEHGRDGAGLAVDMGGMEAGDVDVRSRIKVSWGSRIVEQTLRSGHPRVARWLYEHAPKGEYDHGEDAREGVIREALDIGDMEFAEVLVPEGRQVLDYAMNCKRVEVIERLVEGGYFVRENFSASFAITQLARANRLDLIERILMPQNLPRNHSQFRSFVWRNALSGACRTGSMRVLHWLFEHREGQEAINEMKSGGFLHGLLCRAAEGGHVEVMEYLCENDAVDKFGTALFHAIRDSKLDSVRWLVENFPQSERIPFYSVMDEAAKLGRLEILQYLQVLGSESFVPGWTPVSVTGPQPQILVVATDSNLKVLEGVTKKQSKWRPTDPMDHAAANGHLHVVQWLNANRPEGCSSVAINAAAANGHLDIVQWLSSNRSEVCATKAMDGAASNGNLKLVQWLHENVNVGCTTDAMDFAACHGHLAVLEWLHVNRSEGCTIKAIEGAVSKGHLRVACWLQMRYPQYLPVKIGINLFGVSKFEIFLFVRAHYTYIFTPAFIKNILRNGMAHNPNGNNDEIVAWLQATYPPEHSNVELE